jgi:hypothetical protein
MILLLLLVALAASVFWLASPPIKIRNFTVLVPQRKYSRHLHVGLVALSVNSDYTVKIEKMF